MTQNNLFHQTHMREVTSTDLTEIRCNKDCN